MLDKKLQLKVGQTIAVAGEGPAFKISADRAVVDHADAVLFFAADEAQLRGRLALLRVAAQTGTLTWLAYPKAQKLGTDINRDVVRRIANDNELDSVRQIAIDETWSALRLKLSPS